MLRTNRDNTAIVSNNSNECLNYDSIVIFMQLKCRSVRRTGLPPSPTHVSNSIQSNASLRSCPLYWRVNFNVGGCKMHSLLTHLILLLSSEGAIGANGLLGQLALTTSRGRLAATVRRGAAAKRLTGLRDDTIARNVRALLTILGTYAGPAGSQVHGSKSPGGHAQSPAPGPACSTAPSLRAENFI